MTEPPVLPETLTIVECRRLIAFLRTQSRTHRDVAAWPGLRYLTLDKLPKEEAEVLEARKTRSRLQAASMLGLPYQALRNTERIAIRRLERQYRKRAQ